MKRRFIDIFLDILKAVFIAALAVPSVFLFYRAAESYMYDLVHLGDEGYHSGFGLLVFLSVIFLIFVGLCVLLLIGLAILITRLSKTTQRKKNHTRFFLWLLLAPPANVLTYVAATVLMTLIVK